MIRFIICDDNADSMERARLAITKMMISFDYEYRVDRFEEYNQDFKKLIEKEEDQKIYILDIELPNITGLEIAAKIRAKDWKSIIIFATAHPEYNKEVFYKRLLALDFIPKYETYENRLQETLLVALKQLEQEKALVFKIHNTTYVIPYDEILYIEKVFNQHKCKIVTTTKNEFDVNETLEALLKKLGPKFYQSHRCGIVNVSKIRRIDYNNNMIIFKNGQSIDLLSDRKKKGLKEYVGLY